MIMFRCISIISILIWNLSFQILITFPCLQRFSVLINPSSKWQPFDENTRRLYLAKPYIYEDTFLKRFTSNILGDKETPWI